MGVDSIPSSYSWVFSKIAIPFKLFLFSQVYPIFASITHSLGLIYPHLCVASIRVFWRKNPRYFMLFHGLISVVCWKFQLCLVESEHQYLVLPPSFAFQKSTTSSALCINRTCAPCVRSNAELTRTPNPGTIMRFNQSGGFWGQNLNNHVGVIVLYGLYIMEMKTCDLTINNVFFTCEKHWLKTMFITWF